MPALAASATLVAVALVAVSTATGAPFTPRDDAVVLERLPERGSAPLRELGRLSAILGANPRELDLALDVARRSLEASRTTGDPRYAGRAQAALAPWWSQPDAPPQVLLLRAAILQNRHEFDAALADLGLVLVAKPGDAQALLTRATVLTVTGRYDEALRDCRALARAAVELAAVACASAAASLNGNAEAAYRTLVRALDTRGANATLRAWATTLAGEIAGRRGELEAAEAHFRAALALAPGDAYTRAAYADLLLDARRPREVVALLARDIANDALLLRLALAERDVPELAAAFAEHRAELAARFAAARTRGDALHLREQARFQLDVVNDPREALALARRNWAQQREPADLRLLAGAARAAGDRAALEIAADWLAATKLEDRAVATLVRSAER